VCSSDALRKWRNEISTRVARSNATETYKKLKRVYGEHTLSRTRVFRWHKAFLESVEDEPRSGRPCTLKMDENVTKIRDLVRSDRRLTE